jgi:hypothetical protein
LGFRAAPRRRAAARPQEQLMRGVKEETNEHYRALLAALAAIQAGGGGGDDGAAAPEDAAAVMVHNRALLRNKRLMLAYVCVPPPLARACACSAPCCARVECVFFACAGFRAAPRSQQRARRPHQGAALDGGRRLASGPLSGAFPVRARLFPVLQPVRPKTRTKRG